MDSVESLALTVYQKHCEFLVILVIIIVTAVSNGILHKPNDLPFWGAEDGITRLV